MFQIEWIDLAVSALADGWVNAWSDLRTEITNSIRDIETSLTRAEPSRGVANPRYSCDRHLSLDGHVPCQRAIKFGSDFRRPCAQAPR